MKRVLLVLFAVAIAAMFLCVAVQPVSAGSDKAATGKAVVDKGGSALKSQKVNINTANLKTLSGLKGIGPERAKNIIDYRSKNGSFKSIEDLKKVKGIGDRIYSQISSMITVK